MIYIIIASIAFILFESRSIEDYATGFSTSIMVFTVLVFFIINILELENITDLIRKFEDFIEMSK